MKFSAITLVLLAFAANASVSTRVATPEEVSLLCKSVEASLIEQESDVEILLEACLNGSAQAQTEDEVTVQLIGDVPTTWAGINDTDKCSLTYKNQPRVENIVGGISEGVDCR